MPEIIRREFVNCVNEMKILSRMEIRRPYSSQSNVADRELVGFCDASGSAYCATVYMRSVYTDGNVDCYLICSKTKVKPLSSMKCENDSEKENSNIHRLELMGAGLLSELIVRVSRCLEIDLSKIKVFSDSKVFLCWLAKPAETWKMFVSNRIKKIQKTIPYSNWSYVPTKENPADLGTRKISASKFLSSNTWLSGPEFIRSRESNEVTKSDFCFDDVATKASLTESKIINVMSSASETSVVDIFQKCSNFARLERAVAFIFRWKNKSKPKLSAIEPRELSKSFAALVKCAQYSVFSNEIDALKRNNPIAKRSPLKVFCPFLDSDGVLRAFGRLEKSDLSASKKNPIIMNSSNPFVILYANYIHRTYFHAGAKFIAAFLASRFRFIGGVSTLCKNIIRKCVICARFNRSTQSQLMGQLPRERITVFRPFT